MGYNRWLGTDLCPKEFTARLWGTEHLEAPCWHCLNPPCFKTALISSGCCHSLPSAPVGMLPSCPEPAAGMSPGDPRKGFLCERCQHSTSFSTDSILTTQRSFSNLFCRILKILFWHCIREGQAQREANRVLFLYVPFFLMFRSALSNFSSFRTLAFFLLKYLTSLETWVVSVNMSIDSFIV